jgi:hypothetical protein
MSKGTSSIGTCIAFSATLASDQTAYEGLTWTPSGEITNVGDYGVSNEVIKFNTVCDGVVNKRMGATDYGTQSLEIMFDSDNAAQAIIAAKAADKTAVSVRVTLPLAEGNATSDIAYYRAYVQQAKVMTGGSGDTVRYSVVLEIDGAVIEVDATT